MTVSRRGFFGRLIGAAVAAKAAPSLLANEPPITSAPPFTADGPSTIGYMAFGPDGFTVAHNVFDPPTTGEVTVSGLGFQPKTVIFYDANGRVNRIDSPMEASVYPSGHWRMSDLEQGKSWDASDIIERSR